MKSLNTVRLKLERTKDKDADALVEPCSKHWLDARFKRFPVVMKLGFAEPDEEVRYAPSPR